MYYTLGTIVTFHIHTVPIDNMRTSQLIIIAIIVIDQETELSILL